MYFTSLINYKFSSEFSGFMQFLRFTSLEFDSMPNVIKLIMNQGSRTETLIRNNDSNFYDIATMIEMNPFKLYALFWFNIFWLIFSLIPFWIKNKSKKNKINRINEVLFFNLSIIIFMLVFWPFGFSSIAEVENIGRTSPYKIVSVISTFIFIMLMIIFIITLIKTVATTPILTDIKVQKRFNMLHIGMKRKKLSITFYPILFTKQILWIIFTVALKSSLSGWGIILFLMSLITVWAMIYLKPFELKQGNILIIFSELLQAIYYFLFVFCNSNSVMTMTAIGWIQIILILIFIFTTVILSSLTSFKNAVQKNFMEQSAEYDTKLLSISN